MQSHESQQSQSAPSQKRQKRITLIISIIILVLLGVFIGVITANEVTKRATFAVPDHISKEISFTIYLPKKLPDSYKLDTTSYTISEETLIFRATNKNGETVVFTEQKKPEGFDFNAFYADQFSDATSISDAPFPSVYAIAPNKSKLVSVITDDTWIMISGPSTSATTIQDIAKQLRAVK